MINSLKSTYKLLRIFCIFYKHGGLLLFSPQRSIFKILNVFCAAKKSISTGDRLCLILQDLGPFFVKIGQTLATRTDLVGHEIARSLSRLHTELIPRLTHDDAKIIVESELKAPLEDLYNNFAPKAFAAGSIAEIFRAEDKDGNKIAVKVLKPGIEKQFREDLDLLCFLAKFANRFFKKIRRLKLLDVVKTFEEAAYLEMDLRLEGAAASQLQKNHINDASIYIPKIYWNLTSKRILTLEWIDGISIADSKLLKKKKHDLVAITEKLTVMFLNQAYRDGFFHADLHPGNIFILKNGKIALLDFGIMGRLDKKTRTYLMRILHGFLTRNYEAVANVHFKAGYVHGSKSKEAFIQACRAIGEPIVGQPLHKVSIGKLLAQLFSVTKDFDMEVQPQLLMVQRTTVMLEGISATLEPNANMWSVAESWIHHWSKENLEFKGRITSYVNTLFKYIKNKVMSDLREDAADEFMDV